MAKFIAHFITAEFGVQSLAVDASSAKSAKNKAAAWAKRATRWGDVSIIVETFTVKKLDKLEDGLGKTRREMGCLWRTYTHIPPNRSQLTRELCELHIFRRLHILMAQRSMFNSLTWNKAIS